jgi:hypothetical protein
LYPVRAFANSLSEPPAAAAKEGPGVDPLRRDVAPARWHRQAMNIHRLVEENWALFMCEDAGAARKQCVQLSPNGESNEVITARWMRRADAMAARENPVSRAR